MLKPLWDHQSRAIDLASERNEFALFFEPGTGKTRTTIEILNKKMAKDAKFLRTLVLAPLSVCSVWDRELRENGFVSEQIILCDKSGARRKQKLHDGLWDTGEQAYSGRRIVIMNYEAILGVDLFEILMKWSPEVLICDESHRLKSHDAKRSKLVERLGKATKYRYILSGTPILKDAQDIYQQYKILDRGQTFGDNFYAFKNKYFWDKNSSWKGSQNYFPKYEPRPESVLDISNKIKPSSMSIKKTDCLDLPPLIRQTITNEMSAEQKRVYEEMRKDMVSYLNSEKSIAAVATIALTKALRFQQIVSGFIKPEGCEPYIFKDNPRLRVLKDLLSDAADSHKVIVWANFRENYKMIAQVCQELDYQYVELHGEIPGGERAQNLKDFQENDEVRIMIANQHSGGIGVSMTAASYAIYYSKNFSLEDDVQSEARNHRGGSEIHKCITRIDLMTPDTIDEGVNLSLANKQAIGYAILEGLKK